METARRRHPQNGDGREASSSAEDKKLSCHNDDIHLALTSCQGQVLGVSHSDRIQMFRRSGSFSEL